MSKGYLMPITIPINPEDRQQLYATWQTSPDEQKASMYSALQRRCCFLILQGWEEVRPHRAHTTEEKIQFLLAYKSLDWIWFNAVPKSDELSFTVYVRDDRPEDEGPDDVNEAFDMSMQDLLLLCQNIEKPVWAKRNAKQVSVSIQSFPYPKK